MKFLWHLFLLFIFLFLLSGCENKKYVDVKPQLKIIAVNKKEQPVNNAEVQIFKSESDWKSLTNEISEKSTNRFGEAVFKELEKDIYYFYIEKDTLNNRNGIASHKEPLEENAIKEFTVTLK